MSEKFERDWSNRASCLDTDPELFFPIGESALAQLQIQEAQAVCTACPVRAPCLAFALQANVPYGVWGGASPQDRSRMRRRSQIVGSGSRRVTTEKVGRLRDAEPSR